MAKKRTLVALVKTVTLAGTAEALVATETWVRKLSIKALAANAGVVYVGTSTVSSADGYQLAAGVELPLTDLLPDEGSNFKLDEIYIDSDNNGDGVCFLYWE
jgi:hypothetical protein